MQLTGVCTKILIALLLLIVISVMYFATKRDDVINIPFIDPLHETGIRDEMKEGSLHSIPLRRKVKNAITRTSTMTRTSKDSTRGQLGKEVTCDNNQKTLPAIDRIPEELARNRPFVKHLHGDLKAILIWNVFHGYGGELLQFGSGEEPFHLAGCEVQSCFVTSNRRAMPLQDFDAIIFHLRALTPSDLPWVRSFHQRYILWEIESSSYTFQDLPLYDSFFNWTFTFRKDSDIWDPYGRVIPREDVSGLADVGSSRHTAKKHPHPNSHRKCPRKRKTEGFQVKSKNSQPQDTTLRNYAVNKTKMAAWFVSNCYAHSRREKIMKALQNYFQVDIFGACGDHQCPHSRNGDCFKMLERDYKFYLSFENSLCKDYVTEKFFRVLRYNIVPVVFGMANYEDFAPPNSYVDVLSFPDVNKLAEYLLYLNGNDTAYNEYFRWKGQYEIHTGWSNRAMSFCDLCKELHTNQQPKSYENLSRWFDENAKCHTLKWQPWMNLFHW